MATRSTALLFLRIWVIMIPKKIAKTMIWTRVPLERAANTLSGTHSTTLSTMLTCWTLSSTVSCRTRPLPAPLMVMARQPSTPAMAELRKVYSRNWPPIFFSLTMSATLAIPAMMLNSTRGYTHIFSRRINSVPIKATYEAFSLKIRPATTPSTRAMASFTGILSFFFLAFASLITGPPLCVIFSHSSLISQCEIHYLTVKSCLYYYRMIGKCQSRNFAKKSMGFMLQNAKKGGMICIYFHNVERIAHERQQQFRPIH